MSKRTTRTKRTRRASAPEATTTAAPPSAPTPQPLLPDAWHAQHEAVVGLTHRNAEPPLPCQDAACARVQPRPCVIVADGAGSSAVSEIGAQAVVTGLARLLHTLEHQASQLLDPLHENTAEHARQARSFALLLAKHALGLLTDLAQQHHRPLSDLRCTLLLALVGQAYTLWLRIGDGALVAETLAFTPRQNAGTAPDYQVLGQVAQAEFANQTQFLDAQLQPEHVQSGILDSSRLTGLAAMSDGAAEKLVARDGSRVANQLRQWLAQLRQDKLARRNLTRGFYSEAFCTGSTGDDCSLALLARPTADNVS